MYVWMCFRNLFLSDFDLFVFFALKELNLILFRSTGIENIRPVYRSWVGLVGAGWASLVGPSWVSDYELGRVANCINEQTRTCHTDLPK